MSTGQILLLTIALLALVLCLVIRDELRDTRDALDAIGGDGAGPADIGTARINAAPSSIAHYRPPYGRRARRDAEIRPIRPWPRAYIDAARSALERCFGNAEIGLDNMADTTAIAWTRSTFNPWTGCTKVSPGCDGCYAEALDQRHRLGGATHWGAGVPRYRTSAANWAKPLAWNKAAPTSEFAGRKGFWPVFCGSMCDVFDNEVPEQWRIDLWALINSTPNLEWLLVTKRIGNVKDMLPGAKHNAYWPNVRIIITVVNPEEAERDIPKLFALNCKNGVSYEPALELVDWRRWLGKQCDAGSVPGPYGGGGVTCQICNGWRISGDGCPGINWIIVGGESSQPSHPARPFDVEWARSTISQCKAAGVPVFVTQLGSLPFCAPSVAAMAHRSGSASSSLKDRAGADPPEWPADLRVREWPE